MSDKNRALRERIIRDPDRDRGTALPWILLQEKVRKAEDMEKVKAALLVAILAGIAVAAALIAYANIG